MVQPLREEQWSSVELKAEGSPQLPAMVHSSAPQASVQQRVDQVGELLNCSAPVVSAGTTRAASVSRIACTSTPAEGARVPAGAGASALGSPGASRVEAERVPPCPAVCVCVCYANLWSICVRVECSTFACMHDACRWGSLALTEPSWYSRVQVGCAASQKGHHGSSQAGQKRRLYPSNF
jgi:hypothetical protein